MESSKDEPAQFWKILKEMNETPSSSPTSDTIYPKDWLLYFKNLLNNGCSTPDSDNSRETIDSQVPYSNQTENKVINGKIQESEIRKAISNLKNNKASAEDKLCNEMFKCGGYYLTKAIQKLFNIVFESGKIPQKWNTGLIVPIFKSGSKLDTSNYRGIAISSCLGKLFTSVLNARLVSFLNMNNLLTNKQFGFRKDCRTTDNLFILKTLLTNTYIVKTKTTVKVQNQINCMRVS